MYLLYLDEFGHDGVWDPSDSRHQHHPLFGLAGFALPGESCRDFDRGYLRLKHVYYANEIRLHQQRGVRAERYEPKRLRSRRDLEFAAATLAEIKRCGGTVFVQGVNKPVGARGHNIDALYTNVAQRALTTFELFLRKRAGRALGCGIIVMDERDPSKDRKLLGSVQSHIYSPTNRLRRIAETPLLVPSDWYHGVQAADTIARIAGAVFRVAHSTMVDKHAKRAAARLSTPLYELASGQLGGSGTWSTIHVRPPRTPRVARAPVSQDRPRLSAPLIDIATSSGNR